MKRRQRCLTATRSCQAPVAWLFCAFFFHAALLVPEHVAAHGAGDDKAELLTQLIAAHPRNAELYAERGAVYRDNEHWSEALDDYRHAMALDPDTAEFRFEFAQTLFGAGHLQESLDVIESFLNDEPMSAEGRLVRGRIFAALGAHTEAARDFQQVVAVTQEPSPDLILECANAHATAGNPEAALLVLEHGSAAIAPLVVFEERSIELEIQLGRFESALSRVESLLAKSSRKDRWLTRRGDILDASGRSDEAALAYQQALDSLEELPRRLRDVPAARELALSLRNRLDNPAPNRGP